MAYTVAERLTANKQNNPTPSGNMTIGGTLSVSAMSPTSDTQNTSGTTTSTTYTATLSGGSACGIAFTAPPSGKVMIFNQNHGFNSGANHNLCTIRVRTGASIGSGSDVVAASDADANLFNGVPASRQGVARLVTGLTPGSSYNVQQLFRVDAGTGTFSNKHLIVEPTL